MNPSVSVRILIGLVVGLAAGIGMAAGAVPGLATALAIAQPVGQLWLDALTMTIVPLVFGLLVTGIAAAAGTAAHGNVAGRALLWFAILLTGACVLAAIISTLLLGIWPVPAQAAALRADAGAAPGIATASQWLTGFIPTNPIKAAADTAMVPIVVFALLFGSAMTRIALPLRTGLVDLFRGIVDTMLVLVGWVLLVAPVGVLALAFGVGARMGLGAAGTLVHYVVIVSAVCLLTGAACYVAGIVAGRIGPVALARAMLPSQVVALSTQSSLASLPAMVQAAGPLAVTPAAAGVVLPLAVSLFRAASAAANVAVSVYLAHLYGIILSPAVLATGVLVAVPVSLAAVGLPAQVSFFTTIGPVCIAMGVPLGALPLLLAVETIPDIFRTLGNVTADLAVLRIVARDGDGGDVSRGA